MADDIKIKLGLDAAELFNGLNKVTTELNQVQNESKQTDQALDKMADINTSSAVADVNKLSAAIDGVGDSAGGLGGVFEGLKGGLGDALSGGLIGGLVGGGLAAGVQAGIGAVVDGFGAVVDAGRGLISAQGDLQAQTGATGAEFEALKASAEDAFLGGVGESVAEATKVISNAAVVLKGALPADEIGAFTAKAQALGNLYEKDVNEVISKSAPFIKQFGLDGDEAFNLIAFAAKEGKTSQDDVLDTLAEYSQLLSEAGFSAEEFAGQMAIAGQEGLFNTDKIADSIKEAQIRLKAGDTAKAFTDIKNQLPQALGSTLGNLEQLASSGQITIKEFLQKSGESIKTAFDAGQISEAMATQLQVAVAGTPAEDIGVEAYNKMFGAPIPVEEIKAKAAQAGQDASNAVGQYLSFDVVGRNLSLAFEKGSAMVVGGLSTTFGMIAEAVGPTLTELGDTMTGVFERMWTYTGPILGLIGGAIINTIVGTLNSAMVIVNTFYSIWTQVFDAVVAAISPLVDVIKQAFGMDGALGEGMDVVEMFQEYMNTTGEIMREIGSVVAAFGGLLVEFLITPLQTSIEVIADIVRSIAGWMQSNDENTESVKQSGEAVNKSKGFIDTLRQAFDNIRGTIGGVRESFIQIKTTIGEFWDAITQLDIQKALSAFTGFGEKLTQAYDKGFNATKENINKTREVEKKAEAERAAEQVEAEKRAAAPKAKAPAGEKKPAGEPSESEYKKALARYKSYIDGIEIYRKEQITKFEQLGLNKEEIQLKLSQDPNAAPTADALTKTIENTFGTTRDAQGNLVLGVKLGKTENIAEATLNVRKLLTEVGKFEVRINTKLGAENDKEIQDQLKNLVKRIQDQSKSLEGSLDKLIPASAVKTTEELKKVQDSYDSYANYVKGQALDIQAAIDVAIGLGDEKTQRLLEQQLDANQTALNDAKTKLDKFAKDSAAEIEKNSGLSGALLTFQAALNDAFNIEKIRKERETNEQIRQERLGALNAEEDDLNTSLAKREISFEDYAAKIADIDAQRKQVEEQTEVTFLQRLKGAGDQAAASVLKSQSEIFKKNAQGMEGNQKIFNEFVGQTLASFGELAASGKATLADFGGAVAGAAFDAVAAMIPSFVVGILGSSITTLGPIFGPLAAAALTGTLYGLLGLARSAVGFKDGVVGLEGPGDERSDSIPAWLSKGESVITAAGTKANRQELEWMNNNPGMSIRDYFTSNAPQVRYSVQEDGNLIQEVRKLREETRGLGKQINRNTHVEISGALVADNNSIKAVIERDRRRNARRG
jgi:phage-related minor tail protein